MLPMLPMLPMMCRITKQIDCFWAGCNSDARVTNSHNITAHPRRRGGTEYCLSCAGTAEGVEGETPVEAPAAMTETRGGGV